MITRAGQIMATRAVFDALPIGLQDCMREVLRAEFKGLQDRIEIFQVILEKESAESTRLGIPAYRKSPENSHEMVLRYRGQSVLVNGERRSVILGREESCDLIVQNDLASRMHCRIELRFGKFVIADQSTNGTFIRTGGDAVAHLSREEVVLHGNGSISLGQTFAEHPTDIVEFSVISAQLQH
jgi:pSer/pThr/pTyr-binding forkhead associated (FHA) protein